MSEAPNEREVVSLRRALGSTTNYKTATLQQKLDFAARLTSIKHEAGTLGLFSTMQKLDLAVNEVGFEIECHVLKAAKKSGASP